MELRESEAGLNAGAGVRATSAPAAAAPPADVPAGAASCANCGAAVATRWCGACGQRVLTSRHTLRSMATGFADRVLNLERGLLHTAWRLLVAPGQVVREYLAGRTMPYVHPIGYMVLSFAAFALSAAVSGGSGGGNDRVFVALLIPFVAVASRVLFLRAGLTLAEHLILATYLLGHTALMLALLQLPMGLFPVEVARLLVFPMLALVIGWLAWAYARVLPARPLLAAIGGLAALAVGIAAWGGFMVLLLRALR